MNHYYLYILECSDGKLYTGITNNLNRRLKEHEYGKDPRSFTYKRRPVKLIFHEAFNDIEELIYFEKKIKKWSAQKKRALVNSDFDRLELLSECRNSTHSKYQVTKKEIQQYLENLENKS